MVLGNNWYTVNGVNIWWIFINSFVSGKVLVDEKFFHMASKMSLSL